MPSVVENLATIEIFASLSEEDRFALSGICVPTKFLLGEIIAREGLDAAELFAFIKGKVGIWVDYGTAKADLLAVTEAPCLVGEMSVADELPRSATIIARTDISGYTIDANAFRHILLERGSIALSLMKGISRLVRSSNDSFVSELRNRNKELLMANKELKQAQKQLVRQERLSSLGKFSSMIIHDLRNPLSVIKGYADMMELKLESSDSVPNELKRYIAQIRRETGRLTGLTNEWMDYSRGEIRLVHSPIQPRDLFEQLKENVEAALNAKDITVTWNLGYNETILIDVDRILRVLINLVDNARKATARNGNVKISIFQKKETLCIQIHDDGIGMDAETQAHVFDPFYSKSDKGGIGLGMHIVKTIVNAHDGSIRLDSEIGKGTEVSIHLPLRV